MVFAMIFVEGDIEPLEGDSFLVYKFYVYRVCDGLKFSFTELFLPCLIINV